MVAVNSWQNENRGAEVSERERLHIHPFYAQRVSDGGIRSINTRNHHALAASGASTSISPNYQGVNLLHSAQNITRRPHQRQWTGLQTQATGRHVTELVGRWISA